MQLKKRGDFQEWKEILLGNIDVINKSYYFLTVLNLIQHLIFYSADNALGHFTGDTTIKRGLDSSKLFYPDICMCLSQVRA